MNTLWKKLRVQLEKNPASLLFLMYLVVIAVGTILLCLPIATQQGVWTNPLDSAFTATSALCVTGLVTVTTWSHWSLFGQVVILLLIQLGGLGIMTASAALALMLKRRISMKDRLALAGERNALSVAGIVRLIKYILKATFLIEGVGAVLLAFQFIPQFGLADGIWKSVFHSISAYCNAGFDILGDYSLAGYSSNVLVLLVISSLIVLGGIGFYVYRDVLEEKHFKKLSTHSKIVLSVTGGLLLGGTLLFLFLEWGNPETLGKLSFGEKLLNAFFQSTTTRTAGFFSISQGGLTQAGAVLTIILMFIGGSPAGTAGGVKTTTFLTAFLDAKAEVKSSEDVIVFKRRLSNEVRRKATSIIFLAIVWCVGVSFLMMITDPDIAFVDSLYEVVSGFGTVGLTRGITPFLSAPGKLLIMISMIVGKLGPLTMFYAFTNKEKTKKFREAEETILIG